MLEKLTTKCWECDKPITRSTYDKDPGRYLRYYCEECGAKALAKQEQDNETYRLLGIDRSIERAIEMIEKNKINPIVYREYLREIREMMVKKEVRFDSSHEIVVACELMKNKIPVDFGFTIKRYRPDFTLHSLKIILEVDGINHAMKVERDKRRDEEIIAELGSEWEIVHFPTVFVEKHLDKMAYGVQNAADKQRMTRLKYGLSRKNEFTDGLKEYNSKMLKEYANK